MKRNYRFKYGADFEGYTPVKIQPPVFRTPLDAWNHFVRHQEDFELYDLDDKAEPQMAYNTYVDVFDYMDNLTEVVKSTPKKRTSKKSPQASVGNVEDVRNDADADADERSEEKEKEKE